MLRKHLLDALFIIFPFTYLFFCMAATLNIVYLLFDALTVVLYISFINLKIWHTMKKHAPLKIALITLCSFYLLFIYFVVFYYIVYRNTYVGDIYGRTTRDILFIPYSMTLILPFFAYLPGLAVLLYNKFGNTEEAKSSHFCYLSNFKFCSLLLFYISFLWIIYIFCPRVATAKIDTVWSYNILPLLQLIFICFYFFIVLLIEKKVLFKILFISIGCAVFSILMYGYLTPIIEIMNGSEITKTHLALRSFCAYFSISLYALVLLFVIRVFISNKKEMKNLNIKNELDRIE